VRVEWQTTPLGPELASGEAHIWTANARGVPRCLHVLSEDERDHVGTFRFEEDRRRWATSRVLLRLVLARYLDFDPHRLELATAARGRRIVLRPDYSEWLSFSHARSGELCVAAVARDRPIGVDVERMAPDHDVVAIARRALGDDVAGRLATLPDEARFGAFYRAWVCEEAAGKCRGTGLVEPDDVVRRIPAVVNELALRDGYAGALATDAPVDVVRGFTAEV
jgi:4'-phosphopantetheinyl transferase